VALDESLVRLDVNLGPREGSLKGQRVDHARTRYSHGVTPHSSDDAPSTGRPSDLVTNW